jgi:hypothetical protein
MDTRIGLGGALRRGAAARRLLTGALVPLVLLLAAAPPAAAQFSSGDDGSATSSDPWQAEPEPQAGPSSGWVTAGAVGLSLFYTPVKLTWAATGAVVAGLAWCLSAGDTPAARRIFVPAVFGDYVVLPSHLRRERPFHVAGQLEPSGAASGYAAERDASAAPPVSSAPWDSQQSDGAR